MRPGTGLPSLSRRSRILLTVALVIAVLLLVGPKLVGAYTNWLWFGEVGFHGVYLKVLLTRLALFAAVTVVPGGIIATAMVLAYRTRPLFVPVSAAGDPIGRYRAVVMRRPKLFGIGIPLLIGLLCGLLGQSNWQTVQLFLHGKPFGVTDPQFGLDVSFYAFRLPFYRMLLNWLFVSVVIAFFASLVTHYLFAGLRLTGRDSMLTRPARIQLAALAGTFVVLKAVAYWFDRYTLLSSTRKEPTFTGGSYTDINAVLPAKLILMSIAIVCAVAFFAGVVLRDLRVPALAAALMLLSSVLVGAVWPLLVEQFSVRPNAADKERVYIQRNITATRTAYGITDNTVTYRAYGGAQAQNPLSVPSDVTTVRNIRLLDPTVLSPTFTAQRQLKNFYGFPAALGIDRYTIDGKLQDYVVAARELSPSSLSGNQTDWINRHTVYTHGQGFAAAPANTVSPGDSQGGDGSSAGAGYPQYLVSDLDTHTFVHVDQPRIYYGEVISQSNPDYAIVGGTDQSQPREYDSDPTPRNSGRYTYTGRGGVPIGNWLHRLAFAARYTERNILFSGAIGADSKIIFHRDPRDRVQRVAPWLTVDNDEYPAVVNGRIVWIVDAYTTLENYPYAQHSSLQNLANDSTDQATGRQPARKEVSYIRNSVKAIVDAYDGTVNLYQVDRNDPVLSTWMSVFPGVVHPESAIPPDLRAHFRYPEDLFKVQREMLAKYHVDDPREFFTNNAFWSVPTDPTVETGGNQPPYYLLRGDRRTGAPTFELTSAMVGYNREFLSAYISVRSDPQGYGKFTVLTLPTDTTTQGPQQTQNTMISDPNFAKDRSQIQGSNRITFGNLLTLPIAGNGFLYVEPMYTERNGTNAGTFPQLSKVLVSYQSATQPNPGFGYASALGQALDAVLPGTGRIATAPGGGAVPPPAPPSPAPTPAPAPPSSANRDAAVAELGAAVDRVEHTGNPGDLAAALQNLQKAISDYNAAGK